MTKFFGTIFIVLVFAFTYITVHAQPRPCQKIAIKAKQGQRLCERQCPPSRLPFKCATVRLPLTIRICPRHCCRIGDGCRQS